MKTRRNYRIDERSILLLIKTELKSRHFFNVLRTIGLDDAFYQPDLGDFILPYFNLDTETNEVLDFYYHLFEKYSKRVEENHKVLEKLARQVFAELEKNSLAGKSRK